MRRICPNACPAQPRSHSLSWPVLFSLIACLANRLEAGDVFQVFRPARLVLDAEQRIITDEGGWKSRRQLHYQSFCVCLIKVEGSFQNRSTSVLERSGGLSSQLARM